MNAAVSAIDKVVRAAAEKAEVQLPHLSREARHKFRATAFLFLIALKGMDDEDLPATIAHHLERRPIRQAIVAAATVVLHGVFGVGSNRDKAASMLWSIAAAGEDAKDVEDALDSATVCESKLDPGPSVPFTPGGIGLK